MTAAGPDTFDEEAQLLVEAVDLISARLAAIQAESTPRLDRAGQHLATTERGLADVEAMLERVAAHMAQVPELVNGDLAPTAARLDRLQSEVHALRFVPVAPLPSAPARDEPLDGVAAAPIPPPPTAVETPDDWIGEAPIPVAARAYRWIVMSIVCVGVGVGLLLLRPSRGGAHRRFDTEGAVFFVLAVALLLTVLNQGQRWGWTSPATLGFLAAFAMAAFTFFRASLSAPEPAIDLRLYRNRDFSVAVGVAFLSFIALTPIQQFLPYYLHFTLGMDVAATGIRYATVTALVALLQPFSGIFADTFGSRRITSFGLLIQGIGLSSLVFLPDTGEPAWLVVSLALIGVGVGMFRSPNNRILFASVPRDRVGTAGAYQHLPRELAHSLGETTVIPILAAVVLAAATTMHLESTVPSQATVQVGQAGAAEEEEEEEEELDELFENSPVEAHMVGYRTLFGLAGIMVLTAAGISYFVRSRALELDTEVALRAAARAAAAAGKAPPPPPP